MRSVPFAMGIMENTVVTKISAYSSVATIERIFNHHRILRAWPTQDNTTELAISGDVWVTNLHHSSFAKRYSRIIMRGHPRLCRISLSSIAMKTYLPAFLLALGLAAAAPFASAQTPAPAPTSSQSAPGNDGEENPQAALFKKLGGITEGVGKIGYRAEIDIPEGFTFFPAKGTQEMLKLWGNLVDGTEDGLLIHNETGWSVVFEFKDTGYVKDDDKNALDADAMLKAIRESEPASNEARKEAGLPAYHTVGFAMPPKYNETTHNLEWALRFTTEGESGEFLNYHTKLLGRKGVMNATLLVDPEEMDAVLPVYQKTLTGYRFVKGDTYAEYRQGDKLATYGLTGLVVGGGALAASKLGLFSKLFAVLAKGGKAVFAGIAVLVAGIGKLFGKLFGRRDQSHFNQ